MPQERRRTLDVHVVRRGEGDGSLPGPVQEQPSVADVGQGSARRPGDRLGFALTLLSRVVLRLGLKFPLECVGIYFVQINCYKLLKLLI